ncbi:hypothetical protein SAMN02745781_01526 [Vibrio gazogenes DSM 21264]|uniref:Uncharacterized protein n=1 Tax=Vibrio gazogenes DSM 21264 = NBRC 103151 TaxID=1123492 RepID=A0A1M4Z9K5_VIBGA|nr:hypothetical protein SAMN02745781_01526 [Vibrio gazogenes DSM 21264] [Vibrio gazogenes DSM 21264 = NBRC 103151]SJN53907.1 hypothetical protein BQ6471_00706 [Vibrio gazogenes]
MHRTCGTRFYRCLPFYNSVHRLPVSDGKVTALHPPQDKPRQSDLNCSFGHHNCCSDCYGLYLVDLAEAYTTFSR